MRSGVGEQQVRQGERDFVEGEHRGRLAATTGNQPPIAAEGVPERDQRVEHESCAAKRSEQAAKRNQEMPGVADDHGVHVQAPLVLGEKPRVSRRNAGRETHGPADAGHLGGRERRQGSAELVHGHTAFAET